MRSACKARTQRLVEATAPLRWMCAGFGLALALGVGGGSQALASGPGASGGSSAKQAVDRRAFDEAVDLVLEKYVEPVQASTMLARVLSHMVDGLDAHSVYLDAHTRERWRKIKAQGLTTGIEFRRRAGGGLEVAAVMPGSAAQQAGLRIGDKLRSVQGRPAREFLHPLLAQIAATGLKGSSARLEFTDAAAKVRTVDLRASTVAQVDVVQARLLEPAHHGPAASKRIGIICVHGFLPGVAERVRRELTELHRAAGGRLDGLVLDLRGNPGGEVQEALRVAELFVAEGVLVRTRGRGQVILDEERAHKAGTDLTLPIVILQDEASASAAELLAAALRDNGRAEIMGRTSHGKGTVQRLYGLPDGGQLRLTIARYYGPDDRQIDGRGVAPDLPLSLSDLNAAIALAQGRLLERLVRGPAG